MSSISNLIFIFLPMRPNIPLTLPSSGTLRTDHPPRPSFSFSAQCVPELKRGRLLEMRRMCRPKKLWFLVENEGYPEAPPRFNRDDSHMAGVLLDPANAGLDRPLAMLRPGLAQPPPGIGEGLRDKDIGVFGVPNKQQMREAAAKC